jgi:hypothetical protein
MVVVRVSILREDILRFCSVCVHNILYPITQALLRQVLGIFLCLVLRFCEVVEDNKSIADEAVILQNSLLKIGRVLDRLRQR